jgi:hypothetical protein
MFVQECIKGINGISRDQAECILRLEGLTCNWWRERSKPGVKPIEAPEIGKRLTRDNLFLHVNAYSDQHPDYPGHVVREETPFLSMSAGTVSQWAFSATNTTWSALKTAMSFATNHGTYEGDECYLFYCWVIVGMRPAVGVRSLAEEVRELKTYRSFSLFQKEGEIVAKMDVPACQIERFERYEVRGIYENQQHLLIEEIPNPDYIDPSTVVNFREAL